MPDSIADRSAAGRGASERPGSADSTHETWPGVRRDHRSTGRSGIENPVAASRRAWKTAAALAGVFVGLASAIVGLSIAAVISMQMALLMLVALLGFYCGFGILIALYRLTDRLR